MNVLVLNGSPRGKQSNTMTLTKAFIEGINHNEQHKITHIEIKTAKIEHCIGCFECWLKTPGKCVLNDDMSKFIEQYIQSDIVIWSFPLYYFGMPSKIKAFLDRLLPINLPAMDINEDGTSGHRSRYDLSTQRNVLISTCGFFSVKNNYEALLKQFEIMFGENMAKVICPEGELLKVPQLATRCNEYFSAVTSAGEEFMQQGTISAETQSTLSELLYPPNVYIKMSEGRYNEE